MRKYWLTLLTFLLAGCTNQGLSSTNIVNDNMFQKFIKENVRKVQTLEPEWYVNFDISNPVELFEASDCVALVEFEDFKYQAKYVDELKCNAYRPMYFAKVKEIYKGNHKQDDMISVKDNGIVLPTIREYNYRIDKYYSEMGWEYDFRDKPWFTEFTHFDQYKFEIGKTYLVYLNYQEDNYYTINGFHYGVRELRLDTNTNDMQALNYYIKDWEKLSSFISNQMIEEASIIEEGIQSRLIDLIK